MTAALSTVLGLFFAYGLYISSLAARRAGAPEDFLDAGGALPSWSPLFAGVGVTLAGFGFDDHLLMMARFGLQASQAAVALVLVAVAAAILQKRIWLAGRLSGLRSPVELLGAYYGSVALRLFLFAVILLFMAPLAAEGLGRVGGLVETATGGGVSRVTACWVCGGFLFLCAVVGGWRGLVYIVAGQSLLLLALIAWCAGLSAVVFDPVPFFTGGIATPADALPDRIPGVLQYGAGLGKEPVAGGLWTTLTILSFALSLVGIVVSPGFLFLGNTTRVRAGFGLAQVWMIAGLAAGLTLVAGPMLAAAMASGGGGEAPGFAGLIARFAAMDQTAAVCLTLMLLAAPQILVIFFTTSGANILTLDLVARFILPDLSAKDLRLTGRVVIALAFAVLMPLAAFGPWGAAVLATVALSLSAQLLPALLGLCWIPWITRSGVITGLIGGTIMVLFTEPPGLIGFEGLFLDLPWGRWPLTIHSAAWGLLVNFPVCLVVSIVTRGGVEAQARERLHAALGRNSPIRAGGSAARGAKWALILIWAFLGLGPGAILGNDFFSKPMFSDATATLGVPSLWVWQVVFWLSGVFLVWWLAFPTRLSLIDGEVVERVTLEPRSGPDFAPRAPRWIARGVDRLAGRPNHTNKPREVSR